MLNVRLSKLESQVQDFYDQNLKSVCEDRRRAVVDSSNLETNRLVPNGLLIPDLNLTEKILVGVLQWYMPKEIGCLINLWLDEHWGGDFKEIKAVLLDSKETALGFLLVQDRWNERDFYGNVLKKKHLQKFLRIKVQYRQTSRPKRKVWRRGYNDKGSLRLSSDSLVFDYRKLKTVTQQLEEEEVLRQKVSHLFEEIRQRLEKEYCLRTNRFIIEFDF